MVTDVPLLNDYKRSFVRNRLLQTFLGGVRLVGCPWYAVVTQILLFLTPLVVVLPAVAVVYDEEWIFILASGVAFSVYAVVLQIISRCLKKADEVETRNSNAESNGVSNGSRQHHLRIARRYLGDDESEIELDGCCDGGTWQFLVPPKRHLLNVLLHPILAGLTLASAVYFLNPDRVGEHFNGRAAKWCIIGFGWFAVLVALFGTVVMAPPEAAAFRAMDNLELSSMSRPVHVLVLACSRLVLDHLADSDGEEETWRRITQISHVVLALLPLLWLSGVVPPLEALVLWLGEQLQVFVFGGSPCASNRRQMANLLLSLGHCLIFYYVFADFDLAEFVSFSCISGYIMSVDVPSMIWQGVARFFCCCTRKSSYGTICEEETENSLSMNKIHPSSPTSPKAKGEAAGSLLSISRLFLAFKEALSHAIAFGFTCAIVLLTSNEESECAEELIIDLPIMYINSNDSMNVSNEEPLHEDLKQELSAKEEILGWISVAMVITVTIANELQNVFMVFGLIRNPLYCSPSHSPTEGVERPHLLVSAWHHIRSLFVNFGVGLFLTFYFKSLMTGDCLLMSESKLSLLDVLAVLKLGRWTWQNPISALTEVATFHLVHAVLNPRDKSSLTFKFLHETSRPTQLLMLSIARDRLRQTLEKVFFVLTLSLFSLEERASRRSYAGFLFQANVLFSPVIFAIVLASSVISAPLMTLFTLPVFYLAFPRPSRFWPGPVGLQSNPGPDSIYYQQFLPSLVSALHMASRAGRLGHQLPGDILVARHEDRIAWIQLLESGNNFAYYSAKGMELQETSCHSLEATRLDDIFEAAFEKSSAFNTFALHSATPLNQIQVETFSDTRNVLTGLIESKDTLKLIAEMFLKTLPWYLFKNAARKTKARSSKSRIQRNAQNPSQENENAADGGEVVPFKDDDVDDGNSLFPGLSASIDAIELDDWPSTTSSADSPERQAAARITVRQWAESVNKQQQELGGDDEADKVSEMRGFSRARIESTPSALGSLSDFDGVVSGDAGTVPTSTRTFRGKLLPPIVPRQASTSSENEATQRRDSIDSLTTKLDSMFLPGERTPVTPMLQHGDNHRLPRPPIERSTTLPTTPQRQRREAPSRQPTAGNDKMFPRESWLGIPVETRQARALEEALEGKNPKDWINILLKKHCKEDSQVSVPDSGLMAVYGKVIRDCFMAVYGAAGVTTDFDEVVTTPGPALPVKVFGGELPRSALADYLENQAVDLLSRVILPSFRTALKLSLDQILLGDSYSSGELEEELNDTDNNWYVGPESSPSWARAVVSGRPANLFSVSSSAGDGGANAANGSNAFRPLYRSRLLRLRPCAVSVARLNGECARALWASLSLELLYLTNDDDERYSIQAEEHVLRNLTVQAADPPLGYAVHSTKPVKRTMGGI